MKDPGKNIRKAFYTALVGLGYPVVDEMTDDESLTNYIILSTQTEEDISTKNTFDTSGTILIDIVTKQYNTNTKDTADDIADLVLDAIKPNTNSTLTDSYGEFQITNIKRISANTLTLPTQTGYLIRKLLRFSFRIVQL